MVNFSAQAHLPPDANEVTLAEVNFELLTLKGPQDPNVNKYARAEGVIYPHIIVPYDVRQPARAVPIQRPLGLKNAPVTVKPWWENSIEKIPLWKIKDLIQYGLNMVEEFIEPFKTSFMETTATLPSDQKSHSPVKCYSWHPYKQMFAIAHRMDVVYVYDMNSEAWFPQGLTHEFQKNITCLEWKPNAGATLAVATSNGVCLWRLSLDSNEGVTRDPLTSTTVPSISYTRESEGARPAWMNFLKYPGHTQISSLSWDPSGQYLATGSAADGSVLVWDVALESAVPLRRIGGGVVAMAWSPNGAYLCVAHVNKVIRIWETKTWESRTLANLKGSPKSICWSPDSRNLLFSIQGEAVIRIIHLVKPAPYLDFQTSAPQDLTEFSAQTATGNVVTVGGPIRQLVLDRTGERLIVSFDGDADGSELLAIFLVRPTSWLGDTNPLMPSGFIRGPCWGIAEAHPEVEHLPKAVTMQFANQFSRGSLLSVCWENGKIGFIPFYFTSESKLRKSNDGLRGW
ncbi:hypothetical protein K7432_000461 [Basidiobolus ranarum]|uniref:Aladin seven-bladed propeller domain-containing protein n=1 Tax=Basidiobolus ranarum TaxID=34480 RepID=A0ABR2X4N9_9FUNG